MKAHLAQRGYWLIWNKKPRDQAISSVKQKRQLGSNAMRASLPYRRFRKTYKQESGAKAFESFFD
jgi:hypothetical protein